MTYQNPTDAHLRAYDAHLEASGQAFHTSSACAVCGALEGACSIACPWCGTDKGGFDGYCPDVECPHYKGANSLLDGDALVAAIAALGVESYVEYTGGGCATIYVGSQDEAGNLRAMVGPGSFEGAESWFDSDISIGSDYFADATGAEQVEEHVFSHSVSLVAERVVAFYNSHPATAFARY